MSDCDRFLASYLECGSILKASEQSGFAIIECSAKPSKAYYVYALIDPRTSEIFYIGKGKNLRWQQHGKEGLKNSRKWLRMAAIKAAGKEYQAIYLATDLTSSMALLVEKQCIRAIGLRRLTNLNLGGIDKTARVVLNSVQLINHLKAKPSSQWRDKIIANATRALRSAAKQIAHADT